MMAGLLSGEGSHAMGNLIPKSRIVEAGFAHQVAAIARGGIGVPIRFRDGLPAVEEGQVGQYVFHVKTEVGVHKAPAVGSGGTFLGSESGFADAVQIGRASCRERVEISVVA